MKSLAREIAFFALFLLLSVLNTWPLVLNLDAAVSDQGDPYLNAWILEWDWWATVHRPFSLFHAPIFHPAPYALAFSEHMFGISIFLFPLYATGLAPITVYNIALLIGFAFSGYGAFALARIVTGSPIASLSAGICFAFVPFRFSHLPHIQHIWAGWLPLILAALIHHLRRPSWGRAALLGGVFLMNGLSNIHWLLFAAVTLAISLVFLLLTFPPSRSKRFLAPLIIALALASLILLPFLRPYSEVSRIYGVQRSAGETRIYSAKWFDWLITAPPNKTYGHLAVLQRGSHERWLFPGVLSLLFAASALLLAERRTQNAEPVVRNSVSQHPAFEIRLHLLDAAIVLTALLGYYQWADAKSWPIRFLPVAVVLLLIRFTIRFPHALGGSRGSSLRTAGKWVQAKLRWRLPIGVSLAIVWVIVGFLGSRGPRVFFYRFLFDHVYGFRAIRVPARFAMIAYVGLVVLVAVGVVSMLMRVAPRARTAVGLLISALFLAELRAAPILWHLALPDPPPVYRWLSSARIYGAVLELPLGNFEEAEYVLRATTHHRPLMNGVSGHFPLTHQKISRMANAEPVDPNLAPILERYGCSLIIVHNDSLDTRPAVLEWLRSEMARGRLAFVHRFEHEIGGDYVFAVTHNQPRATERLGLTEQPDFWGVTAAQKAEQFLSGNPYVYNHSTFGLLESPAPGDIRGKLHISGWALSPYGIAQVNLRFQNGKVVIRASLVPLPSLKEKFPWYPRTRRPGFVMDIPKRPPGVQMETDLQVEIVDGAGVRIRLDPVRFRWLPARTPDARTR